MAEPAKEPTYEECLQQLESLATAMEQGKIGLEQYLTEYEKAAGLLRRCNAILDQAEARIRQLQLSEDGTLTSRPMEVPPPE